MKKIFTLLMLLPAMFVMAQSNITVKFTGRHFDNRYIKLDTIKVKNLTRGWEQTLIWPDTTLYLTADGIEETVVENSLGPNFPNPFHGTTEAKLSLNEAGQADIQVVGIDGKTIAATSSYLSQGTHNIKVSLAETGMAILRVKTETQSFALKMMSLGGVANEVSVSTVAMAEPEAKATKGGKANGGQFDLGDVMSYQGIFTYIEGLSQWFSYPVTQPQTGFELVKLYFPPEGALCGKFSVSASKQVLFAKGNLRYKPYGSPHWNFAVTQTYYDGEDNVAAFSGNSEMYRDLFGWGTGNDPNLTPTNGDYSVFNDWGNNLLNQNEDDIENVTWYTMSSGEWQYLLFDRVTPSGIRFAKALVGDVNGLIILPDDWDASYYNLLYTNEKTAEYFANEITLSNWLKFLESHGAVFLPCGGKRHSTSNGVHTIMDAGTAGYYWTSTSEQSNDATRLLFASSLFLSIAGPRYEGCSVRLVTNVP